MAEHRIYVAGAGAALLVAPIGAAYLIMSSETPMRAVIGAVLAMVAGAVITPAVSSGNRLSFTMAVAAALPFVFVTSDTVDLRGIVGTYMASFVFIVIAEMIRTNQTLRSIGYGLRQLAGFSVFAVVFAFVRRWVGNSLGFSGWEILVPFLAGGMTWFLVEVGVWSVFASSYRRVSPRYLARAGLADANVFVSLIATGGLFGLMFDALGWWALPVALLPYSFAHGAFRRFQETRTTYKQTIRALSQIPEVSGLSRAGHSDRTSELSVAMAKDLGLSPVDVEDVDIAALMHDIGRITLNEPTVMEQGWTEEDLARWGAEIIAGAPSLSRVAGYVRRQYEPFRKPGETSDPSLSTVSRIIKVASAYDAGSSQGLSPLQAIEELHQGAAYEYDPEVVGSLRRVLGV